MLRDQNQIEHESSAVIWSQSSYFATFQTTLQIKKTCFIKIAQLGMLFENSALKVIVKLSIGHKAVILSLSKLLL